MNDPDHPDAINIELDEEGIVRLPGVRKGSMLLICSDLLEEMLTEMYAAGLTDRRESERHEL